MPSKTSTERSQLFRERNHRDYDKDICDFIDIRFFEENQSSIEGSS